MKYLNFKNGQEMYDYILADNDIYCPSARAYVFHYNEDGAICEYSIDLSEAVKLENDSRESGEYWGAFLGWGGGIIDPDANYSPIDYCNGTYSEGWINCSDVIAYASEGGE